jgi:hypothetical protein
MAKSKYPTLDEVWHPIDKRNNQIGADDAMAAGLNLEVAPYASKEILADSQGRYIGNGYTVDDLDMVGTGQYFNNTDWLQMPKGYSMVKNPYQAASPEQIAQRKQGSQVSTNRNDMELMGDEAYNQILQYQKDFADAQARGDQAAMDAAHAAAEEVRAKYGYSGGADGSEHLGLMTYTGNMGYDDMDGSDFGYDNAGAYVSRWQSQIDALTGAILGRDPFSYDKNKDPLYQQYAESYTRGGQRGMQDTLAQVSARTGGLASSYAQSAAQQTYNNYMAALADKVPELQQLAYSMYMDDIAMDRADLDMLMGLDNTDYGRWSDNRNFNYGAYRDSVADAQWQQNFNYQQAQDALAQQNWQSQFDYQMAQDALAQQNWQTQWDYNVLQDELARQDALNKLYAKGSGTQATTLDTIYGMRNEAEVYDFLVGQNYSQGEVDNFLQYWRWNRYNKDNNAVPPSGKVTVPEYGNITEEEAERLVNEGALIITGADRNGDPIFALPANKKNPIRLTK